MIDTKKIEKFIKENIPVIRASYTHDKEVAINPAYEDISNHSTEIMAGSIRIWALREDFILATGIKNAYKSEFDYRGLEKAFPACLHRYINWDDRYGHPSLTISESTTVGVYQAGYVKLEDGLIKIYLASGRYFRDSLDEEKIAVLEGYIAKKFQQAYGDYDVRVYYGMKTYSSYKSDEEYYDHLGLFFGGVEKLDEEPFRSYNFTC